ncbi:MAG: phenylacetate--CoA ligase family protein [Fimbriimonadales bacterium]|nr:phenylacetate--CoA ligase family protein [Fimbriimonadales bacterium]
MLNESQWWPRDVIDSYQLTQFNRLFLHAKTHVPIYRQMYADFEPPTTFEELKGLPILTREAFSGDPNLIRSEHLPVGTEIFSEASTSGTTGVQVKVLTTNQTEAIRLACAVREFDWYGLDPKGSYCVYRDTYKHPKDAPILQLHRWPFQVIGDLVQTGRGYWIAASAKVDQIIELFTSAGLSYLQTMPALISRLIEADVNNRLHFQLVQTFGEVLDDSAKMLIEEASGAQVRNTYSSVETGRIATACTESQLMHAYEESVLLEVIKEDGTQAQAGETGRVVVTALHNYATPFIRYDIGDYVQLPQGPCPCGRSLMGIERVHGRVRERLLTASGEFVPAYSLFGQITNVPWIREYQLTQMNSQDFLLQYVGEKGEAGALAGVVEVLSNLTGNTVRLEVEMVQHIAIGATGKRVRFVNKTSA